MQPATPGTQPATKLLVEDTGEGVDDGDSEHARGEDGVSTI